MKRSSFISQLLARCTTELLSIGGVACFLLVSTLGPSYVHASQELLKEGLGRYQQGQFQQAISLWTTAAQQFEIAEDHFHHTQSRIFLARALVELGQLQRAQIILLDILEKTDQPPLRVQALNHLGTLHLSAGNSDSALRILRKGLQLSRQLDDRQLIATILNDLGNVYAFRQERPEAIAAYTESSILANSANNTSLAIRAIINAGLAESLEGAFENAQGHFDQAWVQTRDLSPSHEKTRNLLSVGMGMRTLHRQRPEVAPEVWKRAAQALHEATQTARQTEDWKNESYAWGFLAEMYEEEGRHEEALKLNRFAVRASQQGEAPEAHYRWEWKTGRNLRHIGQNDEAILAYQRAVDTLQPIRQELVVGFPSQATSFRESIGALFFEMADLLIEQADQANNAQRRTHLLFQTRDTIESFKAAELQDYFKDDCVEVNKARIEAIDKISQTTAIIYPILFPDRTDMLITLGGTIRKVSLPIPEDDLSSTIHQFRTLLEKRTTHQYLPHARRLYDMLIRPLEPALQEFSTQTLVFVPDGSLRTIPMGALHDGKQFLIQKYAVAVTPGLTLTDAHSLDREKVQLLSLGLTEGVQGYAPLPNVEKEISKIRELFPGTTLLNKEFLVPTVEKEMKEKDFTVVHIASHGKFESDVKSSYVLAYDKKLTMDQLGDMIGMFQFRKTPLDLLTMSACETAAGDDRAALGLAGVAVKAGARSALATLWFVNDQSSSALINNFYSLLKESASTKAQSLRHAQLKLLKHPVFRHPGYWSPFLLINNWL